MLMLSSNGISKCWFKKKNAKRKKVQHPQCTGFDPWAGIQNKNKKNLCTIFC